MPKIERVGEVAPKAFAAALLHHMPGGPPTPEKITGNFDLWLQRFRWLGRFTGVDPTKLHPNPAPWWTPRDPWHQLLVFRDALSGGNGTMRDKREGWKDELAENQDGERGEWEEEFRSDYPDATREQVEAAWRAHATELATLALPEPPVVEPPAPHVPEPAARPSDGTGWSKLLYTQGLGELRPEKVSDRELDRRQGAGAEGAREEVASLQNEFGSTGISFGYGPTGHIDRTGRRKSKTQAVKVTAGETTRYTDIKNDLAVIRKILSRHRPLEEYGPALARGRRSQEAGELRAELSGLVVEALEGGANKQAIADVLGCDRKTVSALAGSK